MIVLLLLACRPVYAQTNTSGNAVEFEGSTGYLSLPANIWFNTNFTVEAWVYQYDYNSWARLIDFSDGAGVYNVYLALSDGVSGYPAMGVFTNGGGPVLEATNKLPNNQWVHLAATVDNSNATIYINGQIAGRGVLNMPPNVVRTNDYIGRSAYSGDYYPIAIFDELRIWNVARTQLEIQTSMNHGLQGDEAGLIGYWRFDEGTGTNAYDSSGNGNTAVMNSNVFWSASGAPLTEFANFALDFDGSESVTIPHIAAQDAYPLTAMCWFLAPTNTSGGGLVNKYGSQSYNGWQIGTRQDKLYAWYWRSHTNDINITAGIIDDGHWHHAAFVVDSNGGSIFLDGVLQTSGAWTGPAGACTTVIPLGIGVYPGDSAFTGDIDEVSVWNTALSAGQIQTYMHQSLQGTEPGLVAYYRLNEGIGTNVFDYSTNMNDGTLSSPAPQWIISGVEDGQPPAVEGLTVAALTNDLLSALIDPNGLSTSVWIVYGTTTNYGSTNFIGTIGGEFNTLAIQDFITSLAPETGYDITIIASNAAGITTSSNLFFQSAGGAPIVASVQANTPFFADVTLSAAVNANGAATSVWLAYGPTSDYGTTNFLGNLSAGFNPTTVLDLFSNLPPETTNHVNFIASNSLGSTFGGDSVFATPGFLLGTTTLIEGPAAGFDSIVLGTPPNWTWTAEASVPWLHLGSNTNGVGGQTVGFSFDANAGGVRIGTITFGNQTVTVTQAGAGYVETETNMTLYSASYATILSMAVDTSNNIYFANSGQVNRIDHSTKNVTRVLNDSTGILSMGLDASNNIYVLDNYNVGYPIVELFNPSTETLTPLFETTNYFLQEMAVAPSGDLFFSDVNATNIYMLPSGGRQLTNVASEGFGEIEQFTADAADEVFIDCTNNGGYAAVFKFSPIDQSLHGLLDNIYLPYGITVDGSGNVYVQNVFNIIEEWHASTGATNELYSTENPEGMAVDQWGDIYLYGQEYNQDVFLVQEYIHTFVNASPVYEDSAAGTDSISPVLSASGFMGGTNIPISTANWLSVDGVTNGVITFSFAAFNGPGSRTAYLNVLGASIPVVQGSPTYSLGSTSTIEPPTAGGDSIVLAVSPSPGIWTASANDSWLHLAPAMQNGVGSAAIIFSFDANPGSTRVGSLTIAGQTFTVTQAGANYVPVTSLIELGGETTNQIYGPAVDSEGDVYLGFEIINNYPSVAFNLMEWVQSSNTWVETKDGSATLGYDFYGAFAPTVASDWQGHIYLDAFDESIEQYNPASGTFGLIFSTLTNINGVGLDLYSPTLFAVNAQGNVVFYDATTEGIVEYVAATAQFQTLASGPFYVNGLAMDPAGNVFWCGGNGLMEWNANTLQISTLLSNVSLGSMTVDAGDNVYFASYDGSGNTQLQKLSAATGDITTLLALGNVGIIGLTVNPSGNLYLTLLNSGTYAVYELPRVFVDPSPKYESLAGGTDMVPPIVPATQSLAPPFAPYTDQPWLTIVNVTNGEIEFNFTSTSVVRGGDIVLLGQGIAVSQGTNSMLGTTNLLEGPAGGADSFVFGIVPFNFPWTASASVPWLHVSASGHGGGNIIFTNDPNPGPTRSGTITIAGQMLTVTQAGATYVVAAPQKTLANGGNGLDAPCGVAVDSVGNVYIADTYNSAFKVWSPTNDEVTVLSTNGWAFPYALAVDTSDNVYIADTYNNVLKKWSPVTGNVTTFVTNLNHPFGVAVDAAGNVYFSDSDNNAVRKWYPGTGQIVTLYSNPGSQPMGVAVDAMGNVYWVEVGTQSVREWSPVNNSVQTLFAPGFSAPYGVAVDTRGNVYVGDYNNSITFEWIAASNTVIQIDGSTLGVAVDGNGNIFIADPYDWQVYEQARAFVDSSPRFEGLAGGQDAWQPVLPTNEDLLPPFAPVSDALWLTITGVSNGVVAFTFPTVTFAQYAHITVLGESVTVNRGTNYMIGTTNLLEGPGGGLDSLVFGAYPPDVPWAASANVPWLHVPASGVGGGNVIFANDMNPGPTRSGVITIGGLNVVVTQAGSNYVQAGSQTILASQANGLVGPGGVAVDSAGNVYIADTYANALKVWSPTNNQVSVLVTNGLNYPFGLAVDASNNVYIADTYNDAVKEWSPATGTITTLVTNLHRPYGVALDSSANVYISDTYNNAVREWLPGQRILTTVYSNPHVRPVGLAVDAVGNVYWADVDTEALREWSLADNTVHTLFAGLYYPYGVAVDGRGNVYVADYSGTNYEWVAASNTVITNVNPTLGVAVDGNGDVFIADLSQSLIYELPRVFVDGSPRYEGLAGGPDALPPVLPSNEDILPPFAPTSGQPWVSITGTNGDIVQFTVSPSASARSTTINLYGEAIPIIQTNNVFAPQIGGVKLLGNGTVEFLFTNNPNASFTVLGTSNLSLPISNWTVLGVTTNISTDVYEFIDTEATNVTRFYRVRSP